ncbi:ER6L2 protein, partial [Oreotrochilus melanogaster]|nr:ER6L2 protein [Oreotrochilus melanogaster]
DGVQEVAYIHSNQNVVGSSKAENHLSRWAVRDVFELKQFSQLPANVAVCSAKVKRNVWEIEDYTKNKSTRISCFSCIVLCWFGAHLMILSHLYSVMFQFDPFFLLDNCRRQLEEMVSHFNMGSVEKLAEYIAKATSEKRQKMLKEFYVTKHPEMESFFPVIIPTQASNYSQKRELGEPRVQKRKFILNFRASKSKSSSVNSQLLSGTVETQNQQTCNREAEQLHNDSYMQDTCIDVKYKQSPSVAAQHIKRKKSQAIKDFMASGSLSSKSEIIEMLSVKSSEGQQNSKGTQLPRKRFLSQSEDRERKAQTCEKKSFMDLLGDTSILNDLFKNDGNKPTESPRLPSGQVEKSKDRPKDFWDMLNEDNEESLRKLTDIAVIQQLCERAPHPPVTEERGGCESSLWKKNENFLWKKYSPDD